MLVSINGRREYFRGLRCGIMTTDATVVVLNHGQSVLMKPPPRARREHHVNFYFVPTKKIKIEEKKKKNSVLQNQKVLEWFNGRAKKSFAPLKVLA